MSGRAPWVSHFGFSATPFGKGVAAADLLARPSHDEAVARIRFCVAESLLGVIVGEVGVGKTVALRAAVAGLDPAAHQVVYIADPAFGTRGLYVTIVTALGATQRHARAELMAQAQGLSTHGWVTRAPFQIIVAHRGARSGCHTQDRGAASGPRPGNAQRAPLLPTTLSG